MAQAILYKCKLKENGIEVVFHDLNGRSFSDIYNGKLSIDDLNKLVGTQISFTDSEKGMEFHKAWDGEKPVYCDDPKHGMDRAD